MTHDSPARAIRLDAQPNIQLDPQSASVAVIRLDSDEKAGMEPRPFRYRNLTDTICAISAMLSLIASAALFSYCLHLSFHFSAGGTRYIGINSIILCHKLAVFGLTIAGGFYFLRESAELSELAWLRSWLLAVALISALFWLSLRLGFIDNHDCILRG